jgi:hypothetical protein
MCASGQAVIVNGGKIAGFDTKMEAARAPRAASFNPYGERSRAGDDD